MYESYTHYLPIDSERVRRFAIELAAGYCNLCDAVVAPSTTLADCLRTRGVHSPIEVIPTGNRSATVCKGRRPGFPGASLVSPKKPF